ncbi:alpha/beta hydrolase [Reyranella sp. CPCC 100927]|uniref:alpha/beta hydrolase n=1 Tax=Reyranella sp. CPCC 100927 TaxID=2599616 RepID=UPI0011B4C200|nr:alpha/beta hydrolase [Reyranella sp. CPCC 100927]TWT15327.1 alpha/beta hydrolase [Reyranella sp. CPCC 100927]
MSGGPRTILDRRGLVRLLFGLTLLPVSALAKPPPKSSPRPKPQAAAPAPAKPLPPPVPRQAVTRILPFQSAPFPYRGLAEDGRTPFFNVSQGKRRGRTAPNGEVLWEDTVYADAGVLLHVPASFDPRKPARLVVFFHGHGSSIDRVVSDMEIVRQITQADINAVLIAPQFAREAADSSAGKFWQPGAFARFLEEAVVRMTDAAAVNRAERPVVAAALRAAPVILVAFSGGYKPAAYVLDRGGATGRVSGVLLLDALYDEEDRYARWFTTARARGFLVSLYTDSTAPRQAILMDRLRQRHVAFNTALPGAVPPGTAAFVACGSVYRHGRFVLDGPPRDPVRTVLAATRPPPPPPPQPKPTSAKPVAGKPAPAKPPATKPPAVARKARPAPKRPASPNARGGTGR